MKKYKVILFLLALSAVLAFSGCSSEPAAITSDGDIEEAVETPDPTLEPATEPEEMPEQEEVPEQEEMPEPEEYEYEEYEEEAEVVDAAPVIPPGFILYNNSSYGFTVHYPDFWVLRDGAVSQEEIDLLIEAFGDEAIALLEAGSGDGAAVTWFDPTTTTADTMANINITVTPSGGLTQEMLRLDESKEIMQEIYDDAFSALFESFVRTSDVAGAMLGGNYFVLFEADTNVFGTNMSFAQAATAVGANLFTFTFTAPRGGVDVDTFMAVLGTFDA